MEKEDGGPAFPVRVETPFGKGWRAEGGMSLRDYFAAAALTGILVMDASHSGHHDVMAKSAYELADAMIAARQEKP